MPLRIAGVALSSLVLVACGDPTVIRVVDGRPQAGRFIADSAYAAYAHAAEAEAARDLPSAIRWMEAAAAADPEGPEPWTRLGELRCRIAPGDGPPPPAALADFARAEKADPRFAPLFRARARCLLDHHRPAPALIDAERATALDPDDSWNVIVRAQALMEVGREPEAERALRALTVRYPRSAAPWIVLQTLGIRTRDQALMREAAERSAALSAPSTLPRSREGALTSPLDAIDAALAAGDLARAQALAHQARLPWAELALRAAALGRPALAREQAELVLGADPTASGARVALAVAADLAGDHAAAAAALRDLPARSAPLSTLGRLLLAELVARHGGEDAARAVLDAGAGAAPIPADDALLAKTAARVRGRLGRGP